MQLIHCNVNSLWTSQQKQNRLAGHPNGSSHSLSDEEIYITQTCEHGKSTSRRLPPPKKKDKTPPKTSKTYFILLQSVLLYLLHTSTLHPCAESPLVMLFCFCTLMSPVPLKTAASPL